MATRLFTGGGQPVHLGSQLWRGGEGVVLELAGNPKLVAKLYHKAIDAKKQYKLSAMPGLSSSKLSEFTAWPQQTLHETPGGPVTGFLMPRFDNREPIHMLYSPAHRRQDYPNAAWDFLVVAARNIAACFSTLHEHGHLVGDVNQGNALVGKDARVVLIDCDSFQVNAHGQLHLCEVGVSHFTPPELQGSTSFDKVQRTENHDNFGLALLLFHTLFGGRHPYSGVPVGNDGGEIESNIKALRYAYAPNAQSRGLLPPPRSIPLNVAPDDLGAMFLRAFTEDGARGRRPKAKEWVDALDRVRGRLKTCAASKIHVFPNHRASCPWCELEGRGIVYFTLAGATFTPVNTGFVLNATWAAIEAVRAPAAISVPNIQSYRVSPTPTGDAARRSNRLIARIVTAICTFGFAAAIPPASFVIVIGGIFAFFLAGSIGEAERLEERRRRMEARDAAREAFGSAEAQARSSSATKDFQTKRAELSKLRDEYKGLPTLETTQISQLQATAEARQREAFLDRQFIDAATISGVGTAKKAALRSFGIETAADVTAERVRAVRGFGDVLTNAVVAWRISWERRFVFNPQNAVPEADKNAVRAKIDVRRRTIEDALKRGPEELERLRQSAAAQAEVMAPRLHDLAARLAQAEADASVV